MFFRTCLDLMWIPKWNAGKRWYSGPSASGRGGHGNGRGQVLRVVRNGQGREISQLKIKEFGTFNGRCISGSLTCLVLSRRQGSETRFRVPGWGHGENLVVHVEEV